jgi:hypothetical protein
MRPDRARFRDRQGPAGLHDLHGRVGYRPHLRGARRPGRFALVLVVRAPWPDDPLGSRGNARGGEGAVSEELGCLEGVGGVERGRIAWRLRRLRTRQRDGDEPRRTGRSFLGRPCSRFQSQHIDFCQHDRAPARGLRLVRRPRAKCGSNGSTLSCRKPDDSASSRFHRPCFEFAVARVSALPRAVWSSALRPAAPGTILASAASEVRSHRSQPARLQRDHRQR